MRHYRHVQSLFENKGGQVCLRSCRQMEVDLKVYRTEIGWKDVDWTGASSGLL